MPKELVLENAKLPIVASNRSQDFGCVRVSASCWTRTNNPLIKSQMLCQLS
jgi:hypothetical protein